MSSQVKLLNVSDDEMQECMDDMYQKYVESNEKTRKKLRRATQLIKGFMECQNNDCRCRQGYGLCSQCKDAAHDFLEGKDE